MSELLITGKLPEAQENAGVQVTGGIGSAFDWLRRYARLVFWTNYRAREKNPKQSSTLS